MDSCLPDIMDSQTRYFHSDAMKLNWMQAKMEEKK
jgi:hypothetical protein